MYVDAAASETQLKALELEKSKLQVEVATLQSKLEMQQHHSGGLGAAMLQERLEAQQRHIAALELARKVRVTRPSSGQEAGGGHHHQSRD
jgi:hypothetical protein